MHAADSRSPKTRSFVHLVLLTGWIATYIWLWNSGSAASKAIFAVGLLALFVFMHRFQNEPLRAVIMPANSLAPTFGWVVALLVPIGIAIMIFVFKISLQPMLPPGSLQRLLDLVLLGLLQQYVLLAQLFRPSALLLGGNGRGMLLAASIFALLHWPNPFLMVVTFAAGLAACWLYRRAGNIPALGVAHGLISFALYSGLPRELTHGLRFGPSFE